MGARIPVTNDELLTVRDAMRTLNTVVDGLGSAGSKAVLTRHGKMVAVVVSIEDYARLLAGHASQLPLLGTEVV